MFEKVVKSHHFPLIDELNLHLVMHAIMYYFRRQLLEMSINDFAYSSLKQVKAQKGDKKKKKTCKIVLHLWTQYSPAQNHLTSHMWERSPGGPSAEVTYIIELQFYISKGFDTF